MSLYDDRRKTLGTMRLDAYKRHARRISVAQKELENTLAMLDMRFADLKRRKDEPEVLVRNGPGPAVSIFHDAEDYCGRVNPSSLKRGGFDRVFLGVALEELGLRPCSACATHLVSRRRPRRAA